jgi:hypothetical protein
MLTVRKEVRNMTGIKEVAGRTKKDFNDAVDKLKERVRRRPFDLAAHTRLMKLYLAENMFPEAESEQEILEWLDRIRRNVRLNIK